MGIRPVGLLALAGLQVQPGQSGLGRTGAPPAFFYSASLFAGTTVSHGVKGAPNAAADGCDTGRMVGEAVRDECDHKLVGTTDPMLIPKSCC